MYKNAGFLVIRVSGVLIQLTSVTELECSDSFEAHGGLFALHQVLVAVVKLRARAWRVLRTARVAL